jgi:hypothetical protein
VYGFLIVISAITKKKTYFSWLSGTVETVKNSLLPIVIGFISIITGIGAFLLYVT